MVSPCIETKETDSRAESNKPMHKLPLYITSILFYKEIPAPSPTFFFIKEDE
jgi:hypothetical protein